MMFFPLFWGGAGLVVLCPCFWAVFGFFVLLVVLLRSQLEFKQKVFNDGKPFFSTGPPALARSGWGGFFSFFLWCSHSLSFALAWGVAIQLVTADVHAFMWRGTFRDLFRAFGVKRVACVYSLWTAYRCHHEPRCI